MTKQTPSMPLRTIILMPAKENQAPSLGVVRGSRNFKHVQDLLKLPLTNCTGGAIGKLCLPARQQAPPAVHPPLLQDGLCRTERCASLYRYKCRDWFTVIKGQHGMHIRPGYPPEAWW